MAVAKLLTILWVLVNLKKGAGMIKYNVFFSGVSLQIRGYDGKKEIKEVIRAAVLTCVILHQYVI